MYDEARVAANLVSLLMYWWLLCPNFYFDVFSSTATHLPKIFAHCFLVILEKIPHLSRRFQIPWPFFIAFNQPSLVFTKHNPARALPPLHQINGSFKIARPVLIFSEPDATQCTIQILVPWSATSKCWTWLHLSWYQLFLPFNKPVANRVGIIREARRPFFWEIRTVASEGAAFEA